MIKSLTVMKATVALIQIVTMSLFYGALYYYLTGASWQVVTNYLFMFALIGAIFLYGANETFIFETESSADYQADKEAYRVELMQLERIREQNAQRGREQSIGRAVRTPYLGPQYQSLLDRSVNEYEREQDRILREVARRQQEVTAPTIYITATQNRSAGVNAETTFAMNMDLSGSMLTEEPTAPFQEKVVEQSKPEVVVSKVVTNSISSLQINE